MRRILIAGVVGWTACSDSGHESLGIDAPTNDAATVGDASNVDAPQPRSGYVVILEYQLAGSKLSSALASLIDGSPSPPITGGSSGLCSASTTLLSGPPNTRVSGGTIAVTGTTNPIALEPSGSKPAVSYFAQLSTPAFVGGASITVDAPGTADFPAFSVAAVAPSTPTGFTPPASLSRSTAYTATWNAGLGPHLRIAVAANDGVRIDRLVCDVPDTGSFTIPPAAFALLPATVDEVTVYLSRYDQVISSTSNVTLVVDSSIQSYVISLTP